MKYFVHRETQNNHISYNPPPKPFSQPLHAPDATINHMHGTLQLPDPVDIERRDSGFDENREVTEGITSSKESLPKKTENTITSECAVTDVSSGYIVQPNILSNNAFVPLNSHQLESEDGYIPN